MHRHQARQHKALADLYERKLKLEDLVAKRSQENSEVSSELQHLMQEAAALTGIHKPLKAREGQQLSCLLVI